VTDWALAVERSAAAKATHRVEEAMGKVEEYREILSTLDSWDAYLMQESRLPGPRANLELAFAVAQVGSADRLLQYAAFDSVEAPSNTKQEFLAVCGVVGLGYLAARGEGEYFAMLHHSASDPRWRIREAVALGLQEYGRTAFKQLLEIMEEWSNGTPLERRAVVATLCEPCLLADRDHAGKIVGIIDGITASLLGEEDRRSAEFRVLRKGLAYGWSVAVAAQPEIGKPRMQKWIVSKDPDIRWIMKQNLKKKRLSRMDEAWVEAQLQALGS
jgi:hypothetical protein